MSRTTSRSQVLSCNTGLQQYHAASAQLRCHRKPSLSNGLRRTCAYCSGERSAKKNGESSAPNASRLENRPRGNPLRRSLLCLRKDEFSGLFPDCIQKCCTRIMPAIMCEGRSLHAILCAWTTLQITLYLRSSAAVTAYSYGHEARCANTLIRQHGRKGMRD